MEGHAKPGRGEVCKERLSFGPMGYLPYGVVVRGVLPSRGSNEKLPGGQRGGSFPERATLDSFVNTFENVFGPIRYYQTV